MPAKLTRMPRQRAARFKGVTCMSLRLSLLKPSSLFAASYDRYIKELGTEERYPFPLDFEYSNFEKYLERVEDFALGKNLPKGYVQSTTLWLVRENEIVGVTNIRHELNNSIRHIGGHIGLSIKPTERGKSLGVKLMKMSISFLKDLGISEVHIHCEKSNKGSSKTIQACGGVLESEVSHNNEIIERYIVQNI